MKTLSEQILELKKALGETKDKLLAATQKLAEAPDDATEGAVVELTAELEKGTARLKSLEAAEKALGTGAAPAGDAPAAPAIVKAQHLTISKAAENLLGKLALVNYEAHIKSMSKEAVAIARFGEKDAVIEVLKATQNPAMSNVPSYAGELTTMAFAGLMEMLRNAAILPRATPAMKQHVFAGNSSIHVPYRNGSSQSAAGVFRAEGAPIRVGGLSFAARTLTPKNMAVILTATEEMMRRSSVDLAAYFQNAMAEDTAEALDYVFTDTVAGSAIRPAGIRFGLGAGETRPASGTGTTADIVNDIKVMLTAMANYKLGKAPYWLMAPNNWLAVSMALTATGSKQFPETANGMLAGYPVIVSQTMPTDIVLLVDFNEISCAFGNPNFLTSNVAAIHEEDTAPAEIGGTTSPVRSLFQTNSVGIRFLLDADWKVMRDDGVVQELTAVAWQ